MTPTALQAFLHEYRIGFPVGVDQPDGRGGLPLTMRAYGLRGTPTLLIFDALGRLRHHHFGQVDDLSLGAQIAALILEGQASSDEVAPIPAPTTAAPGCRDDTCMSGDEQ